MPANNRQPITIQKIRIANHLSKIAMTSPMPAKAAVNPVIKSYRSAGNPSQPIRIKIMENKNMGAVRATVRTRAVFRRGPDEFSRSCMLTFHPANEETCQHCEKPGQFTFQKNHDTLPALSAWPLRHTRERQQPHVILDKIAQQQHRNGDGKGAPCHHRHCDLGHGGKLTREVGCQRLSADRPRSGGERRQNAYKNIVRENAQYHEQKPGFLVNNHVPEHNQQ